MMITVIRDSATAMAAICKQAPAASGTAAGRGGTVFPASTSPAALQTDTGEGMTLAPLPAPPLLGSDKMSVAPPAPAPLQQTTCDVEAR